MSSFAQVIDIEEGTPHRLSAGVLTHESLAGLICHRALSVQLLPMVGAGIGYEILAHNTCGQIVIGREVLVRVRPKVPIGNLFRMLELVYGLKSFQFADGMVDIDALPELYERLASILARRVLDRARRGLHRTYINESAALGFVRGRLDPRASMRLVASGTAAVQCEYQEHTSDISDNQILLWTLNALSRSDLQRSDVRRQVRSARRAVLGAATLRPVASTECARRSYHRLNDDYRPMHGLCRVFLESLGPGMDHGSREIMPYTVNTAHLFESFVAAWLRNHGPTNYKFGVQHKLKLGGTHAIEWNVDILVRHAASGAAVAVLDTKYKRAATPSAADIQQVVAYAVEARVERAYLVYPTAEITPVNVKVGDVVVRSACFDIAGDLETGGAALLHQLGLAQLG